MELSFKTKIFIFLLILILLFSDFVSFLAPIFQKNKLAENLIIQEAQAATLQYVGGASCTGTAATYSCSLTALTGGIGAAAQAGDLVIVVTGWTSTADGNPGVTTSGYTEAYDLYGNDTRDANLSVNWKIMGGTPDTSVIVRGFNNAANGGATVVHVWRGANQTTPMDVTPPAGAASNNSSQPDSPSITPVTAGAYVLTAGLGTGDTTPLTKIAPTGYGNALSVAGNGTSYSAIANIASKAWTSGAEDPAAWTGGESTTSDSRAAGILAIRPANDPPALSISQPDGVGDSVNVGDIYNINYSLSDTDNVVTAAFYYDTDNTGLNGTAITGACASAPEGSGITCSWDTTGMAPGSYYVYGITSDGVNPQVSAYSPGMITINAALPNATSFTNNTEGALTDGGRSSQQITVTGSNFGAGPSDGTNNAVKIGTYTVPNGNVTTWNSTTIVFNIPAAATASGGIGANGLIIRAGGVDDTTPLDFYIYPNITSTSANSGQIGSNITVSGDHFGLSSGTITINTKTAAVIGGWGETSLTVRVPGQEGAANINGKIQITRSGDSKTSNQYPSAGNFTILAPSVSGSNPASATTGQTLAIEFSGLGIDTDAGTAPTLKLTKTSQPDIIGTSYAKITDYQTASASFNLTGAATGYWKLVIINMDGQSGSYGDESTIGFNITASGPTVTGINPNWGLDSGITNITSILGTGFQSGATAKLTKAAQADITPSTAFSYTNSTTLSNGAFNLAGKTNGWWNVIVTNPDLQSGSYGNETSSGFEIRSAKPSTPTNIYQFKTNTDNAQPPTTNIAVGGGIGGQTTIYFRMDMAGGLTGEQYFPQVEVKPIGGAFECNNLSPTPCAVTAGFFAEGSGVMFNGTAVQGWVSTSGTDGVSYHWQVRVRNSAGTSNWVSFGGNTDPNDIDVYIDNTAPTISPGTDGTCATAAINITDLGATVRWNTSDTTSGAQTPPGSGAWATGQAQYIKTSQFTDWASTPGALSAINPRENSPHQVNLFGLSPSASYTYRMRSKDAVENEALSSNCTFTTTSTRPIKTVEFFIGQEIAQNTGGQVVFPFTITLPESPPPANLSVKSAYIEITGISSTSTSKDVFVELRRTSGYVAQTTGYTIDSSGTTTPFTILFDALLPPGGAGNGQEDMTDIVTGATPYNYYLYLSGGTVMEPISVFSAKLVITYSYEL